jgi:hypothetical protein
VILRGGLERRAHPATVAGALTHGTTAAAATARAVRITRLWRYLPAAVAACYLLVLATQLSALFRGNSANADAVAPYLLARLISSHHGTVWLGDSAWYSSLLFDIATRSLPVYRVVWESAPFVASAITIAATAWSVRQVAGRWASVVTLSLLTCGGAALLDNLTMLNDHVLTWCSSSLLIAGLVRVLDPHRPIRRSRWVPSAVAIAMFVAFNLASDPLLYPAGVVPVLVGALAAHRTMRSQRGREGVWYALLTVGLALVGSVVLLHLMRENRFEVAAGFRIGLVRPSRLLGNLGDWWHSVTWLGGGSGATAGGLLASILGPVAGVLTAAMVVLVPLVVAQEQRPPQAAAAGDERDRHLAGVRRGFVLATASAAVLISAAFVFSNLPDGQSTARYVIGVVFAAAALAPFLARGPRSAAVIAVAATIYCVSGLVAVAGSSAQASQTPTQAEANTFLALAKREHVSHGYSGYWDAGPITWETRFKLRVYPVRTCGPLLCRYPNASESVWYSHRHDGRTFVITDTSKPFLHRAPETLGTPVASFRVGRSYVFAVYDYEIVDRMVR